MGKIANDGWLGLLAPGFSVAMTLTFSPHLHAIQSVPQVVEFEQPEHTQAIFSLRALVRIGSAEGVYDAFGRVMDAKLSSRGEIYVADGLSGRVVVFDRNGAFLRTLGHPGEGPGEFALPALIAIGRSDSVFVWDSRSARILVFSPEGRFTRQFPVMPSWAITGIAFLPNGRLVVAGYGAGESAGIHVIDRHGTHIRSFARPPTDPGVQAFAASLLGGYLAQGPDWLAYSIRSPYELRFFSLQRELQYRCIGKAAWTTAPADVVLQTRNSLRLDYGHFVHSARVLTLTDSIVMNVLYDPVNDRRVLDLVTPTCRWLRRVTVDIPLMFTDSREGLLLAVENVDFPVIIVYRATVESPDSPI